jgi:xanthine dehydrogenase accessory factor
MTSTAPSLLAGDDVLADLMVWRAAGRRVALVTLVAIDGATPRPLGAQMAVAEDGQFTGYLSGGCIEQSVAEEAVRAIAARENRRVRYGKDSPYFDIKLPCGSGLDLFIDQGISDATLAHIANHRRDRRPFQHTTDLTTGGSTISPADAQSTTHLAERIFHRVHRPSPRVLLVGGGPALGAIAHLIAAAGFELDIVSPDDGARAALSNSGLTSRPLHTPATVTFAGLDPWTAAVVAFHEHDWEAPVLAEILKTPCFYIGVMGGRQAHANRLAALTDMGVPLEMQSRIRSPIGLIPGAKSRTTLAIGILAELVAEAKAAGLMD